MNYTPKARGVKAKINKWDCIKPKGKRCISTKSQPAGWEKIFLINSSEKGLTFKIYNEFI